MDVETKIIELLGQGFTSETVAAAVGLSESRISQLLSNEEFAAKVQAKKFATHQRVAKIDDNYDEIELSLVEKLKKNLSFMYKTGEVLGALKVVNSAKRRGGVVSSPEALAPQKAVPIVLPSVIVNRFVTNVVNQVVEVIDDAGKSSSLITASTTDLSALAKRSKELAAERKAKSIEKLRSSNEEISEPGFGQSGLPQGALISTGQKTRITADDL